MKNLMIKLVPAVALVALVSGCVTKSDLAAVSAKADHAQQTADEAKASAAAANSTAEAAKATADQALQSANEANMKIDRSFKKSMYK